MRSNVTTALLVVGIASLPAEPPPATASRPPAASSRGRRGRAGYASFKGIPFAEPPVGDLRWKPPQPAKRWEGVRKADKFGPRAMQRAVFGDMNFRSDGMSEDCLYLNVWTPAKGKDERLPVLVYFYGGGFVAGDGSEPRYDGESMARRGIVAVTVNYRLGVFGFLAHPELTKESPHHASGNYGLLDQNAAFRWVRQNIAAFGGDPARVTIAGESAGSISGVLPVSLPESVPADLLRWRSSSWRIAMGTSRAWAVAADLVRGRNRFQAWREQRKPGGADPAAALDDGRPTGQGPWRQSHRRGARPRLLQLEETGRGGRRPAAAERSCLRRVDPPVSSPSNAGSSSTTAPAPPCACNWSATTPPTSRRCHAASGTPCDAPDHAPDEDPGRGPAGRFSPRDRRPGPALPGVPPARPVRRRRLRLPQSQGDGR